MGVRAEPLNFSKHRDALLTSIGIVVILAITLVYVYWR